jgi:Flp pilus assembly pilin Flp
MWIKLNSLVLSLYARTCVRREEGQALVEYTLILALVSIAAIALLTELGTDIQNELKKVTEAM